MFLNNKTILVVIIVLPLVTGCKPAATTAPVTVTDPTVPPTARLTETPLPYTDTPAPPANTPTSEATPTVRLPPPTRTPRPTAIPFEVVRDIPYIPGGDPEKTLSIYLPIEESRKHLTLLVSDGESIPAFVDYFAGLGYAIISFSSQSDSYRQEIQNAFCALAWTYANAGMYGFEPEAIVTAGGSMFGGNAAILGLVDDPDPFLTGCPHSLPDTSQVLGVVTLAGVFDYSEESDFFTGFINNITDFMGGTPEQVPEAWAEASAITWVHGDAPHFLLLHGTGDVNVDSHQSEKFASALEEAGVDVELVLIPNTDHSGITRNNQAFEAAKAFLESLEAASTLNDSDGGMIAFTSERNSYEDIYLMTVPGGTRADSSEPRNITNLPASDDTDPHWSPDGSQIAFASTRHGNFEIYIMDLDGSNIQRLTDNPAVDASPVWSPDGTRIAFVSLRDRNVEIYVVNADGSDLQRLTQNNYNDFEIDWSPDGRYIAVASQVGAYGNIFLIDVAEALQDPGGDARQQLTDTDAVDAFPRWSPDGSQIAFISNRDGDGNWEIYVMNSDGSDQRRLTDSEAVDGPPSWSPDGTQIVFESNRDRNFELYIMNSDGSDVQRLTNSEADDRNPDWQPTDSTTGMAVPAMEGVSFEQSPQTFPPAPTWKIGLGDLDDDGDLDAVFGNGQYNDSQIWLNDGSGHFVDSGQQLGKYAHGVDIGDLDGDGDPDVIISTHEDFSPSRVYLNDGYASFEELEGAFDANIGYSVDLFDLDGDGDLDAVGEGAYAVNVYVNNGAGNFTASELTFPLTTIWGDLDSDGDVDVFIKEDGVGYSVRLNDGGVQGGTPGSFSGYWSHADPEAMDMGDMALGDVDKDGDLDVVITNGHFLSTSYPALVFINDGRGQFTDSGQRLSAVRNAGASLGDLDGDGDLDLVLADYKKPCQIWLNDGDGQFTDSGFRFGNDQFYRHAHLGDLDLDGDLDIFLSTFGISNCPNEIWFNQQR